MGCARVTSPHSLVVGHSPTKGAVLSLTCLTKFKESTKQGKLSWWLRGKCGRLSVDEVLTKSPPEIRLKKVKFLSAEHSRQCVLEDVTCADKTSLKKSAAAEVQLGLSFYRVQPDLASSLELGHYRVRPINDYDCRSECLATWLPRHTFSIVLQLHKLGKLSLRRLDAKRSYRTRSNNKSQMIHDLTTTSPIFTSQALGNHASPRLTHEE